MAGSVGVVGGGIMGSGIAEVAARAGFDVLVREVDDVAKAAAKQRVTASLGKAVRAGKISEADREAALARLRFTTDLGELADRDVVIEAVVEDEAEKVAIFRQLGKIVSPECLLASNTSSIPIMKLAAVTEQPAAGHRDALLQPGAGAAAGRAGAEPAHRARRRCSGRRRSPRATWASTPCCARTGPASW